MRAEIWGGGMTNKAYCIENVKDVKFSDNGVLCMIIDEEGWAIETSTSNVVFIHPPKKKGGE